MYLENIAITRIQPCTADTQKIRFKANLSRDISEILPLMNRVLKDAIYNHKMPSLTIKKEFRRIILYSDTLAVAKAINETDAYETTDFVKNLVNNVYRQKSNIEPLYEMRIKPTPMEIYKYLPKINCKKCNEATCLAFASKLLMGKQKIQNCKPLYEDVNKMKLETVENLEKLRELGMVND